MKRLQRQIFSKNIKPKNTLEICCQLYTRVRAKQVFKKHLPNYDFLKMETTDIRHSGYELVQNS